MAVRALLLAITAAVSIFRAALDQRIATRYQVAPMDLAESAQYLRHHLALVSRTDPLCADDAIARLHKASLGLPRALNHAAVAALIAAATAGKALPLTDPRHCPGPDASRGWRAALRGFVPLR
jgi:hypothetical protein